MGCWNNLGINIFIEKEIKKTEKLGNRMPMLKSLKIITGVRLDREIVSQVIFFCACKGIIWRSVEEIIREKNKR